MAADQAHDEDRGGLRGFLARGGIWRWLLVLVVYLVIYELASVVAGKVGGHYVDDDLLSSVGSVFFQVTFALIVGAIVLIAFTAYMGWGSEVFGRQRVYRSWWMWLGPVIVLIPIVLRVLGIEWGAHTTEIVVAIMVTGLLIGFVEELAYRGIGVKMVRDGGHREWVVAAVTSLFFGLSHLSNLIGGQSGQTVGGTVVYTIAFGVLMYLTLRTTGFLVGAMLLHGLTDPTTILATGAIDEVKTGAAANSMLTGAAGFTVLVILAGYVLLIFIRGRVTDRRAAQVA
ncbi:type II CAAX prenyl endopeptidase Rce1 family protein [Cellulomonas sp. PhB150]|uniref:CPBP family glutamic-type intramembrane protease n=1 Tax=Cellulomonas sp. PhB150 TaxID=2485188 RepID=UPI000F4777DC|nr:CPBP family glutamic-type intramembrane protease [Cellulomonas sp. PhB150]ROS31100.1 CAAX prenyl protease-like protein [Cellulomonas sp. PhB150]